MNSKLSLLSRAAFVAGAVALALPALAQTSQPAVPSNSPVVAPAPVTPAVAPAPVTTTEKPTGTQATVDHKTDKSKTVAVKKPVIKTAKSNATHKPVVPASATIKTPVQPAKTDAGK